MSDRDLRNLYEGVRRGDEYVAPRRESELYGKVVREANITITYDTGESETINTSDERAKELSDISTISTTRNQVLYKIDGNWVGKRLGKKQIKDIADSVTKMSDYQTIQNKVIELATKSTIFKSIEGVSSFNESLEKLLSFLRSSAALTLQNNGKSVNPEAIKREMGRIITLIDSGEPQRQLIDSLNSLGDSDGGIGLFKLWDLLDPAVNGSKIHFDVKNHPNMLTLMPAGEDEKTRGAAGPGEALLSFIYGGIKPQGAGDILLSSNEDDTIELKKQEGRIGKAITKAKVSELGTLFYGKRPGNKEKNAFFTQKYYGDNREAEEMVYITHQLPDSFYTALKITKPVQEPGIQIFPKQYIQQINKDSIPLPDDMTDHPNISPAGKKNSQLNFAASGLKNIPADYLAGVLRSGQSSALSDMEVSQFLNKYSGVSVGDKNTNPPLNTELPNISVMDAISDLPGETVLQQIADLIGVWHLKHYLTHIEPFKWLLVYTVDGRAAGVTYEKILTTPAIDLVKYLATKNLRFGIRKDEGGFHIEIK